MSLSLTRRTARDLLVLALAVGTAAQATDLERLPFAPNPGALDAYLYVPSRLQQPAPLVVALHGCTQRASDFDDESGWTAVADQAGALLLLPEQGADNNPARCFNWFNPSDQRRDGGEPESSATWWRRCRPPTRWMRRGSSSPASPPGAP